MSVNRRHFSLGVLALGATQARAQAQSWPVKPIKIIVPYPPGGFTDVSARLVAQKLQERQGQPVTVDNKPGANSIIGVDALAKSPHDGYTMAVVIAAYAANTTLYPKLPYDPAKDIAPVSLIGLSPLVAAVSNDAPFKTAAELMAYAKKHPGKISFGSSGNGSAAHLSTELLKALTGSYMVHIPYRGAAAALTDLMGGQIQLFLDAASGLIQPGKTGKVRGLMTLRQWTAKARRKGPIKAQCAARTRVRASGATPSGPLRRAFPKGCAQKSRARRCNSSPGIRPGCGLRLARGLSGHNAVRCRSGIRP
jgi:tripartite-type tricarboxylate transporter receptor subunit TctC